LQLGFLIDNITQAPIWIAALQIIGVNVILSGDNAVVIALACMTLPPRQRLWGMILGAGVAVLLRVLFTLVVAQAMTYPYLKLAGGVLLLWVAVKLVSGDDEGEDGIESADNLWRAVRIVAIADIVMSLDNVLAIAASADIAAARVDLTHAAAIKATLIVFGLATSIPLIIAGSAVLMALLDRYRVLVWAGGALLGWVAGDIMATDPAVIARLGEHAAHDLHGWAGRIGGLIVVGAGLYLVRRRRPFQRDDIMAAIGLLVWIAGDILIDVGIAETEALMRWLARGTVALALAAGYAVSRIRRRVGPEEA
jgi:YjbE family integral membrane protein